MAAQGFYNFDLLKRRKEMSHNEKKYTGLQQNGGKWRKNRIFDLLRLPYRKVSGARGRRYDTSVSSCAQGAPDTFIIGDMPYMSYEISDEEAIANAGRFIKEAGCDCIKLEGAGPDILKRIRAISGAGILTMGHIGLTPQFAGELGGYKAQGRSAEAALKLIEQAKKSEEAGACSLLVEGVPAIVGREITKRAGIPILGIGAGSYTHGQLLIYADMVGLYDNFTPKFVKKYTDIGAELQKAFTEYCGEVRAGQFPVDTEHTYKISDEEAAKLMELLGE